MIKYISKSMQMKYETTIGETGGSSYIVIPASVKQLFDLKKGEKIIWVIDLKDSAPPLRVFPSDERFSLSMDKVEK